MKSDKPRKEKSEKKYTRAQAERALSRGVSPETFTKHANYHVRTKAWRKMGKPLPDGTEAVNKLLASFQSKDVSKMPQEEQGKYISVLRHRFLGEPLPVAEEVATPES